MVRDRCVFSWNESPFALVLTRSQLPVQISQYFGSQSTFRAKISAMPARHAAAFRLPGVPTNV
jgi:hypothetical protein